MAGREALLIAIPVLNKQGITILTGSLYSLAVGPLWITDPLSGFQVILATLSADGTLILSMFIPVVIALAFGRVFCGWVCPQNTLSELIDYLSEKSHPLSAKRQRGLRLFDLTLSARPRYAVLFILLILTPLLGFPVANLVSAPGIISVQMSKYIYENTVGLEIGLIAIIIISEFFLLRRAWCNYICPVGTSLGILRIRRTLKIVYAEQEERHVCGKCFECGRACRLGLNQMEGDIYPLCHNCGDCIAVCEKMTSGGKPLSFRF